MYDEYDFEVDAIRNARMTASLTGKDVNARLNTLAEANPDVAKAAMLTKDALNANTFDNVLTNDMNATITGLERATLSQGLLGWGWVRTILGLA